MDEKQLFDSGCFLPCWTEDVAEQQSPIATVYTRGNKDLQTLLSELEQIKGQIQDIQERQWNLARLIHFHENNLVKD
ncbi:MAG: hypothetical protein E7Z87_06050 [Cyanobacteria bacterium SIG26]|nr:hypothetical protein [Cyanobacteria bacterium SIG26]